MAFPQGVFSFPGVQQILFGEFTLSSGIRPSTARFDIQPQENLIVTDGTLSISFGQTLLQFPGCQVRAPSLRMDPNGRVLGFSVADRRWRWQFGEVYGRYNLKRADGSIDTLKSTEKTPQQLASILLDAMKETGYNVSALPNGKWRPERAWDGHNPASELAELCDYLGCRVVLGLDNRVRIVKLGTGNDLPDLPSRQTVNYGLSISSRPDSLKVVCGPTIFQTKLLLEAVGLDADGRIKKINDLSYKPAAGWGAESPEGFFGVTNKASRRLAKRTVWRWYRIKSQPDGTIAPPGFPKKLGYIRNLLPIRGQLTQEKLDQQKDPQDTAQQHFLPAYVEGVFLKRDFYYGSSSLFTDIQKGATTDSKGNTQVGARYVGGFSLDEERGLVEFSDWVAKRSDSDTYTDAELYLTCSYSARDPESNLPYRYAVERKLPGKAQGTGPRVIPAFDLYETIRTNYGTNAKEVTSTTSNAKETIEPAAKDLLDAAQAEYQIPATEETQYAGIVAIQPDGAIQQVGWQVSKAGAFTRASRNTEYDLAVPDFKKRRAEEKTAALVGRKYFDPLVIGAR